MNFFEAVKWGQQKFLRPVVFMLLFATFLYPLVPSTVYKYVVVFLLLSAILRLVYDVETSVMKKLSGIESHLGSRNPPEWSNFTAAQEPIVKDIRKILESGTSLHLEIIGVSARFSWRMIEDYLPAMINSHKDKALTITIEVAVALEPTLQNWHLKQWIDDLHRTVSGIENFKKEHSDEIATRKLTVNRFDYDNLPQWHGVLINREILFIGRTEWVFRNPDYPAMKIGQCPYRRFELTDQFGGRARIVMFGNWMDRIKKRHNELHGTDDSSPSI